jgi:hypothetical protein
MRLAPRRPGDIFLELVPDTLLFQSLVIALLRRQQKVGKVLTLNDAEKENDQHHGGDHTSQVQNAPEASPSLQLRIVKYLFHYEEANLPLLYKNREYPTANRFIATRL